MANIPMSLGKSPVDLCSFLARRTGACTGIRSQPGFDSALWTSAIKGKAKKETPILFLFDNKLSEQDDKTLPNSEITRKVKSIRDTIANYNKWVADCSPESPQLAEEDVVVIFPVLRGGRLKRSQALEWWGTLMI